MQAATQALAAQGRGPAREPESGLTGLAVDGASLVLTDGRYSTEFAATMAPADVAVFDRPPRLPAAPGTALAWAVATGCGEGWRAQSMAWRMSHSLVDPPRPSDFSKSCPTLRCGHLPFRICKAAARALRQPARIRRTPAAGFEPRAQRRRRTNVVIDPHAAFLCSTPSDCVAERIDASASSTVSGTGSAAFGVELGDFGSHRRGYSTGAPTRAAESSGSRSSGSSRGDGVTRRAWPARSRRRW